VTNHRNTTTTQSLLPNCTSTTHSEVPVMLSPRGQNGLGL